MVRVKTTALLTTGAAEWRLTGTRGTHIAGKAPACDPHPDWIKPTGRGKWLGSAKRDWPSGITEFSLTFQVSAPQIAHFDLRYAADSKLESATLNGQPLAVDAQKGSNALSVLKAPPHEDLFRLGPNVLTVRVLTAGFSNRPMGFYAEGLAITGEKEYAPQSAEPRHVPVVAARPRRSATGLPRPHSSWTGTRTPPRPCHQQPRSPRPLAARLLRAALRARAGGACTRRRVGW